MSNRRKRCVNCHTTTHDSKRRCTSCFSDPTRNFLREIRAAGASGVVSETLRLTIQNGADINTLSNTRTPQTGLMQAATFGNRHIVQFLIGLTGLDINYQTRFGNTALSIAASHGHYACVALLLTGLGINVNLQNLVGGTALMGAVSSGRYMSVQCLLQHEGIDVNIQDEHGQTALFIAAGLHRAQTINTMVEWHLGHPCFDVNIQSDDGSTALMRAVTYNRPRNVMGLLRVPGLNIVCRNNVGDTALTLPLLQRGAQDILRLWHVRMTNILHRWKYVTRRKRRRRERGLSRYVSRHKNTPHGPERNQEKFLQHSFIKLRF